MQKQAYEPMTTGRLSRRFNVSESRIRRLITTGVVPEPPRVGVFRVFDAQAVRLIEKELRKQGAID